jgi:hypothetical protein
MVIMMQGSVRIIRRVGATDLEMLRQHMHIECDDLKFTSDDLDDGFVVTGGLRAVKEYDAKGQYADELYNFFGLNFTEQDLISLVSKLPPSS